jgi:hypothetical protein
MFILQLFRKLTIEYCSNSTSGPKKVQPQALFFICWLLEEKSNGSIPCSPPAATRSTSDYSFLLENILIVGNCYHFVGILGDLNWICWWLLLQTSLSQNNSHGVLLIVEMLTLFVKLSVMFVDIVSDFGYKWICCKRFRRWTVNVRYIFFITPSGHYYLSLIWTYLDTKIRLDTSM